MERTNLTRRSALKILASAGLLYAAPGIALAVDQSDVDETNAELEAAQEEADKVQEELDQIADEYEQLSKKQSDTLDQIEETQGKIDDLQADIDDKQKELDDRKEVLAQRVSENYKAGPTEFLNVIFGSSSFEELEANVYYMDKISEADSEMIQEVKDLKASLEQQQEDLKSEKDQLEELSAQQEQQLQEMEQKQQETADTLANLSDQVNALIAERDSELEAMAQEKAAQEEAAAAAAASSSSSATSGVTGTIGSDTVTSGSQQAVVNACKTTPSPGAGYCAMWVSMVYQNAGLGYPGGNACDMYNAWCTSSDRSQLQAGMIVAVSSHSHTSAGRIYGHIGIYIGGGMMMDNVGYIRTIDVNSWISYYGTTVTPRWGWVYGVALS